MKIRNANAEGKYYIHILLTITLSISISILTSSTILYINFEKAALSLVHKYINDNLTQVSYSIKYMNDQVKTIGMQILFDTDLFSPLFSTPEVSDFPIITNKLGLYSNISPFIHSIYLYNLNHKKLYTSLSANVNIDDKSFFDKEFIKIIKDSKNYKKLSPIPRKIFITDFNNSSEKFSNIFSYIISDNPQNSANPYGLVCINIDEKWLGSIINSLDDSPESTTFIIDSQGTTVIGNKIYPTIKDISSESYIKRILKNKKTSGYFIDSVNSKKSLVSFMPSKYQNVEDWIFIRVTPYNIITNKISIMRYITIIIGLVILVSGLIISFFLSKKIYLPISKSMRELSFLKEEKRNSYYKTKQACLINIINNDSDFGENEVLSKFTNYDIQLDQQKDFIMILLRIDNYSAFCDKYDIKNRKLLKFGIMNIASEIACTLYKNEAVDMGEDQIVLILNLDPNRTIDIQNDIENIIITMQIEIEGCLEFSMSAAVSTAGSSLMELNRLYIESVNTSHYRMFYGLKSIIFTFALNNTPKNENPYPTQKENLLLDSLMLGKIEELKKHYIDILSCFNMLPSTAYHTNIIRLACAVSSSIDALSHNNGLSLYNNLDNLIMKLNSCETLDGVNSVFYNLFEKVLSDIEKKKNSKHTEIITSVYEIINNDISSQTISLDSIADNIGMSSAYLGLLFKKYTSKSVADYINEVRIEKAKELLLTTQMPISDISEKTGFVNSKYFSTLFKKYNGITPNEFRKDGKPFI